MSVGGERNGQRSVPGVLEQVPMLTSLPFSWTLGPPGDWGGVLPLAIHTMEGLREAGWVQAGTSDAEGSILLSKPVSWGRWAPWRIVIGQEQGRWPGDRWVSAFPLEQGSWGPESWENYMEKQSTASQVCPYTCPLGHSHQTFNWNVKTFKYLKVILTR